MPVAELKTFQEMNAVWDGWVSPGNTRHAPPSRPTIGGAAV